MKVQNKDKTYQRPLVVIGGGITGLAAAYIAASRGRQVSVIEGSSRFGGLLCTFPLGETLIEQYYHHFFTHDREIHWLLGKLGLQDEIEYKNTLTGIFKSGKIFDFSKPSDLLHFKPLSLIDKLRFGLSSVYLCKFASWENYENISALSWFYQHAGTGVTDVIWKPLLKIKFGHYFNSVPVSWIIGRLSQRINSRHYGEEKLGYIKGSLQTLINSLIDYLKKMGAVLILNEPVCRLDIRNNQIISVRTVNHIFDDCDFLFTIPTVHSVDLLKKSGESVLASELEKISYFGVVCLVLEMKQPLSSIYWLNIAEEGFLFGGVIEHTNFISSKTYGNHHVAYLSRYYDWNEPFAKFSDNQVKDKMISSLYKIYPDFSKINIVNAYIFRTNTAATVCDLNFSKKIPQCKTYISRFYLASMCHIYPDERSVNNSIRVAAEACRTLGIDVSDIPLGNGLAGSCGFDEEKTN